MEKTLSFARKRPLAFLLKVDKRFISKSMMNRIGMRVGAKAIRRLKCQITYGLFHLGKKNRRKFHRRLHLFIYIRAKALALADMKQPPFVLNYLKRLLFHGPAS